MRTKGLRAVVSPHHWAPKRFFTNQAAFDFIRQMVGHNYGLRRIDEPMTEGAYLREDILDVNGLVKGFVTWYDL